MIYNVDEIHENSAFVFGIVRALKIVTNNATARGEGLEMRAGRETEEGDNIWGVFSANRAVMA